MIKIKILLVLFISFNVVSKDMVRVDLPYENEDRHYYIYTPNTKETNPIDLVIGLHGYTGTALGFERETTGGFNKAADDYGFIAVYPQGKFFYQKTFFDTIYHEHLSYHSVTPLIKFFENNNNSFGDIHAK